MKNNYRRLGAILNLFKDYNFYCYTIYEDCVWLQGKFHSNIVMKAKKSRFAVDVNENTGYVQLKRGLYTITLTE
jgi:hypothetical protein